MSTKIYHGYRLAEGTDLFAFCERLRALADPLRDELDLELLNRLASWGRESLGSAVGRWQAMQEEMRPDVYGHDPHRLDVVFLRDSITERILALLYTEKFTKLWESLPEVEYFGYWNNTDPDEDCTELEFDQRGEAWERVLGWDVPVRRGLTFTLRPTPWHGMLDLIPHTD